MFTEVSRQSIHQTAGTRRILLPQGNLVKEFQQPKQACAEADPDGKSGMFQYTALAKDQSWKPGPYPGVELLALHRHEATGGVTVLRKFHAGTVVPAHIHPQANETAYILSGEWEESGVVHGAGTLFFAPKGALHGPHTARTEVVSLTTFDGPLTVA